MKKWRILAAVLALFLAYRLLTAITPDEEPEKADTILPISIYSDAGIEITLQDADTDALYLHIENNTEQNIHIYGDSAVINGFSFPALMMQDVYVHTTSDSVLALDKDMLSIANISTVANASFSLHITGDDESEVFKGRVSAAIDSEYEQPVDSSGCVVYSDEQFFISARAYDLSDPSKAILLYVEDNSDNRLSLSCDSMSINSEMLNGFISLQSVEAHTKGQFVIDAEILGLMSDSNKQILSADKVSEASIQLSLLPWRGESVSTADVIKSEVVKVIG